MPDPDERRMSKSWIDGSVAKYLGIEPPGRNPWSGIALKDLFEFRDPGSLAYPDDPFGLRPFVAKPDPDEEDCGWCGRRKKRQVRCPYARCKSNQKEK